MTVTCAEVTGPPVDAVLGAGSLGVQRYACRLAAALAARGVEYRLRVQVRAEHRELTRPGEGVA